MSVGCRIMGGIMVYIVGYITTSVSLKGDKVPLKHSLRSFPRVLYLVLLFYLENIYSKKVVFLIVSEGKKWSLHYSEHHIGGEKWGIM